MLSVVLVKAITLVMFCPKFENFMLNEEMFIDRISVGMEPSG